MFSIGKSFSGSEASSEDAHGPKRSLIGQNSKAETYGSIGQKALQPGTSGYSNYGFIGESSSLNSIPKMDDDTDQGSMSLMNHEDASVDLHIPNGFDKTKRSESLSGKKGRLGSGIRPRRKIVIQRDCIDQKDLNDNCEFIKPKRISIKQKVLDNLCKCSFTCLASCLVSNFPIIQWMKDYKFRDYLLSDMIAGFTIAILHIPQGMGYGLLASVEAINGLYVSFFPVLIYILMGTSRHISIGTFAVASLMVSSAADKLGAVTSRSPVNFTEAVNNLSSSSTLAPNVDYWPPTYLEALTTICLITGLYQAIMGKLHLGAVSVVLTDQMVSGFSTGVAIHVATSQLSALFAISVARYSGPFKLVYTYIEIFKKLKFSNVATILVSAISIFILSVFKEQVQPRLKAFISFPIPIDLIVVLLATIFSYFLNLNEFYNVDIMGDIPTGLPPPIVPRFDIVTPSMLIDSFVIAMITFAVSLSLAKIFAKKHKYKVDPNQELVAMGVANAFSSFFACYPCSASLSRSLLQEKTGGKTQMAGIVSCILLLTVLLFLAPFLYTLPKCILSAIILVALKGMFMQVVDFKNSWKVSRVEAMIWMVTFVGVIVLDIDYGLIIGVVFSLFTVLFRSLYPNSSLLARIPSTEIYVDSSRYQLAKEISGMKIFHFNSAVFFMNRDVLKQHLFELVFENTGKDGHQAKDIEAMEKPDIHTIIIDCSAIPYIDSAGIDEIMQIAEELNDLGIKLYLAACTVPFFRMLENTSFVKKIGYSAVFPTIHDAVVHCSPYTAQSEMIATV